MKWIMLLVTPSLLMGACNTFKSQASEKEIESRSDGVTAVHCIYNDSIDKIIRYPSCVKLYQMVGLVRDSAEVNEKDSLFNYPIDWEIGKLDKKMKLLLDFIISDETQYRSEYNPIRQPFNPTFALEFIRNKQKAFYFVSFGTGELAVADEKGQFKFFLMRDSEIMKRWYSNVLATKEKSNNKKQKK